MKSVRTPGYNYEFNSKNGHHTRWGFTVKDDPQWSPIGPEILDIEVSEVCHGGCAFCYKSNTSKGKNMSLETFKTIIDKMPMLTVLKVTLENGEVLEVSPSAKVELASGQVIKASQMKAGDDLKRVRI